MRCGWTDRDCGWSVGLEHGRDSHSKFQDDFRTDLFGQIERHSALERGNCHKREHHDVSGSNCGEPPVCTIGGCVHVEVVQHDVEEYARVWKQFAAWHARAGRLRRDASAVQFS